MTKQIAAGFLVRAWPAVSTGGMDKAWSIYEDCEERKQRIRRTNSRVIIALSTFPCLSFPLTPCACGLVTITAVMGAITDHATRSADVGSVSLANRTSNVREAPTDPATVDHQGWAIAPCREVDGLEKTPSNCSVRYGRPLSRGRATGNASDARSLGSVGHQSGNPQAIAMRVRGTELLIGGRRGTGRIREAFLSWREKSPPN
jgi:hypothetical protein